MNIHVIFLNILCFRQSFFNLIEIVDVQQIPDGKEFAQFVGHQGLVYDLQWSPKDTMLLSASADCTACLWDSAAWKSTPMQVRSYINLF